MIRDDLRQALKPRPVQRSRPAFTLVELLVAVSVMSLIVLVLFRIFDQTQRALRSNVAQVDIMEGSRALLGMLARDLEQAAPVNQSPTNVNFYLALTAQPQPLDLPGEEPQSFRVNEFYELYFLSPMRQQGTNGLWRATMFRVLARENLTPNELLNPSYATNLANEGVGWLARRSTIIDLGAVDPRRVYWTNALYAFPDLLRTNQAAMADFQQVVQGVVHFRVTPLDSLGRPLGYRPMTTTLANGQRVNTYPSVFQRYTRFLPSSLDVRDYEFMSNSVPAAVQVELGLMEPQIIERWRSLPTYQSRTNFLNEQAARIHYFQQRISLPNAPRLLPIIP